jgi:hypothetical protein
MTKILNLIARKRYLYQQFFQYFFILNWLIHFMNSNLKYCDEFKQNMILDEERNNGNFEERIGDILRILIRS